MSAMNGEDEPALTRQSVGLTLVGVLVGIGATVGFGISGPWWVRLGAGAATIVGLVLLVGLAGRRTRLLARLANWITGR